MHICVPSMSFSQHLCTKSQHTICSIYLHIYFLVIGKLASFLTEDSTYLMMPKYDWDSFNITLLVGSNGNCIHSFHNENDVKVIYNLYITHNPHQM